MSYRPKLAFCGPVATMSGYGCHARDLLLSLIEMDKFDIQVISINWGETPMDALDSGDADMKKINVVINKVDPIHDVAVLKTNNFKSNKFLNIKTKFPRIGNDVWVAGAPEGLDGTISNGIISAIRKEKPYDFDLIQFTAPISFGSSGGPLINPNMDLIGITVLGIDRNDAQNLNFAVPSKYISHLLDEENN